MPDAPAIEPGADQARKSIGNRLRHLFGLRQSFRVGPVRYRELTADSLRHALSRSGAGHKEYDAAFADGTTMRVRCTRDRVYADLAGPRLLGVYRIIEPQLRPGMRVLLPQGGTGYAGAWAAGRVAPSGAVVSLEADAESVEFAQHRYHLPNVSFELGGTEALAGETDGAFDGIMSVESLAPVDAEATVIGELWRLVRPGGWVALASRRPAAATIAAAEPALQGRHELRVLHEVGDAWSVVQAVKPDEERRS